MTRRKAAPRKRTTTGAAGGDGAALVVRLAKLSVAGIADQFDRRGIVPPVLARELKPVAGAANFAGPAFCVAGHRLNIEGWRASSVGRDPLYDSLDEKVPAGAVLVFSTGGYDDTAVFGGGTGLAMQRRGVAGAIVDGAVRDVCELGACGLPVLARAVSAIRYVGRFAITAIGHPIKLRGLAGVVRVTPGDLVLSDADGTIVVAAAMASAIIEAAERAADIDAKVQAAVLAGMSRLEATRKFKKA